MKFWQHQKYSIRECKDKKSFGLVFDMGMGKTITALELARIKDRPVLVIAPQDLCEQWKEEAENFSEKDFEDGIKRENFNVLVATNKKKKQVKFNKMLEEFLKIKD